VRRVADLQHLGHDDQRDKADRHVDVEDPAPTGDAEERLLTGEEATYDRSEDGRRTEDGEEVALVARTLAGADEVTDDREREGEQTAGADALDRAERG